MKKNPWFMLFVLLVFFGGLWGLLFVTSGISLFSSGYSSKPSKKFSVTRKDSILHLKIEGVIMDGKRFLDQLIDYREDDRVKAIVIEVNSPGGVVGPSQEIYEEIRRARENFKKPVVIVSTGLMASGAYYAAVAGDKVIVQPGTLVGSIGVIMEFTNLKGVYEWAKVNRFSINTGKYKDSGAEYRDMREDERLVFQSLVDDVLTQFVEAVAKGRNLSVEKAREIADGRVFTGRQAKELGLVDDFGTRDDAFRVAAELAGLKEGHWEVLLPPKPHRSFFDMLTSSGEEEGVSFNGDPLNAGTVEKAVDHALNRILKLNLNNQPLFLMPGVL